MPDGAGALPRPAIPIRVLEAKRRAAECLLRAQGETGAWEGEVVWCPVITAQVAIAHAILGQALEPEWRRLALHHFARTQLPTGGWGLHPESDGYRFVTTLVYVAARLLGAAADAEWLARARAWLSAAEGDIYGLPSWGKFWLCQLALFGRAGLNPCPPELFLLPAWLPFAPDRLYCHTRSIYLGMATLTALPPCNAIPLAATLREELGIDGRDPGRHRHELAVTDAFVRPSRALRLLYDGVRLAGRVTRFWPGRQALRRRALNHCLSRMAAEARASRYQGLSPVSGVLAAMALSQAGRPEGAASLAGLQRWVWVDEQNGLRHAGARSVTWDTAFAVQALLAGAEVADRPLRQAHARLLAMQERDDLPADARQGRQSIQGGWCFSDGTHRWPVSDCTAEALSAVLLCEAKPGLIPLESRIAASAVADALRFLLDRQNADGGFGTYERRRAGPLLERLNPSEMFGNCMTELSYIECTASALAAVHHARRHAPAVAATIPGLPEAADRAQAFLIGAQRADGFWPGFWGINAIYGTLFAVSALAVAGLDPASPALRRAAAWLRSIQKPDGGWGEDFSGCTTGRYVAATSSLVVGTSWAVLALAAAEGPGSEAAGRGAAWLAARQQDDGTWPADSVNGVFFGTAMLDYRLYGSIFPTWALARVGLHLRQVPV